MGDISVATVSVLPMLPDTSSNSLHENTPVVDPTTLSVEAGLVAAGADTGGADPKTCKHSFIERDVYECEHCTKAFSTAYNLNRHKKGNCQENICKKCNQRFLKIAQLKDHNLVCTGKQPYQCEFCGKAFMKNINLSRHRLTHTERCELCNALFYQRIPLITLYPEEQVYTCLHCEEKCRTKLALEKHSKVHYDVTLNQCKTCHLSFVKKSQLRKHTMKEHPGCVAAVGKMRKTYECSVCLRIFLKKKDRKKHLQVHLEAGMKIHSCKECDKSYTAEKTLKMHMIKHGSDDKKPRCKVCNKMFSHPFSLRYHMRIHNNCKPCVCSICNQAFRQAGHLKRHLMTHNEQPLKVKAKLKVKAERQYKCDVCGRQYATVDDLKHHKFTHTGEKKFSCNYCGKSFLFKRTLTHHVNTHTGAKPYPCNLCEKAFAQPGSLHKHKQTHAQVKTNANSDSNVKVFETASLGKVEKVDECVSVAPIVTNGNTLNNNGLVHVQHASAPPPPHQQQQLQQQLLLTNQLQPIHNTPPQVDAFPSRVFDEHMQRAPEYRSDCGLEQFAMQHVHLQFTNPFKPKAPHEMQTNPYWHLQQSNIVYQHQANHPMERTNVPAFLQPPNNQHMQ